jgi:hypothetical protein
VPAPRASRENPPLASIIGKSSASHHGQAGNGDAMHRHHRKRRSEMPDTTTRPRWAGAAALVLAGVLAGCGGEGSGQPPVAAAPGPASGPTPAPSPTPTPAISPDPKFANASLGEEVYGPASCGVAPVSHDASGAVTGVGVISDTFNELTFGITYVAKDTYKVQSNDYLGFTINFRPETRQAFPSPAYVRFADPLPAELLLSQLDLQFVVLGSYASGSHCIFAAGLAAGPLPSVAVNYSGVVDGIAQIDGGQWRIFDASGEGAKMDFDFASRQGTLSFRLIRRSDPFGNFQGANPVDLGTVTANLTLEQGRTTFSAPVSGAGYTGTVRGQFLDKGTSKLGAGVGGAGVAVVYDLRSPTGNLIYGAVAYAANLI